MTEIQAPPAHRTLASELRWVRANLPADTPQSVTRALDAAVTRAETEADQARIWCGEAADRENAVARFERVRAETQRIVLLLPPEAEGEYWVLDQITQALEETP